jgi:hypothetical protein
MAYLDSHPPARSQFRCPRRAKPSGVVVVHTAENVMDTVGPDTGAEAVARFIQGRDTPGSYHDLVDSDSILDLVRYECEAFQDGTGSNPHAYAVSAACSYLDWAKMSKAKRDAFVENMAQAVARYARWVKKTHGVTIPARRITRAQSDAGVPGFLSHAERDPARRKDPGNAAGQFPWDQFLARFAVLMAAPAASTPVDPGETMTVIRRIENRDQSVLILPDRTSKIGVRGFFADKSTAAGDAGIIGSDEVEVDKGAWHAIVDEWLDKNGALTKT